MSVRKRKQKTVIYKRAEFNKTGLVLETLLNNAFSTLDKPSKRRQDHGHEGDIKQVIGAVKKQQVMLCGTLLMYEVGKDVAFVVEDDDADEYAIESQNPSVGLDENDKRKREVLQSALYFGIWGNHVVLVQSQALQSRQFETHINWLLGQKSNVVAPEVEVSLSDEPTQEARANIENLQPRVVEIGTPFNSSPVKSEHANQAKIISHKLSGRIEQLLEAFLEKDIVSKLRFEEALDDSNLEATLQLRYKRKSTESGYAALDNISRALRHAEPEDTKVITSSGTVITGDMLKLTGTISVDTYNGVVDNDDLFAQMFDWLANKIEEGSVG
ncbi:hypothetical protein [Marinomonas sp.]|uniref:hypothetical protein n=1 Tax=Marinomonas sp. TaxID=1904862 RepID=UPI003A92203A